MANRVSLMLSIQTYREVNAVKDKLEKIIRKKLSNDDVVQILLAAKSLDAQLEDLILQS